MFILRSSFFLTSLGAFHRPAFLFFKWFLYALETSQPLITSECDISAAFHCVISAVVIQSSHYWQTSLLRSCFTCYEAQQRLVIACVRKPEIVLSSSTLKIYSSSTFIKMSSVRMESTFEHMSTSTRCKNTFQFHLNILQLQLSVFSRNFSLR